MSTALPTRRDVRPPTAPQPGPLPAYSEDGVDLTLIRWMLSLSPMERLEVLQQTLQSIESLRRGLDD